MSQTWEEKSKKGIIGDDEKHNFELAIIAGCLQRIAKAQEKIADYPEIVRENMSLRKDYAELFNLLNRRKWYQFWKPKQIIKID